MPDTQPVPVNYLPIYLVVASIVFIILMSVKFKLHPFLALLLAALGYGFAVGMPADAIVASINNGFGNTMRGIGLVIVLGVIIGAFLEKSGGAYSLAEMVLKVVGPKRVPLAMGIVGYIVSIPVFADSGFMLISPLNKGLSKRAGISLAGSAIALSLGLTATHVLVPPTPGPIYAAGALDADLGLVLLMGMAFAALGLVVAVVFATKIAAKTYVDPNPEVSEAEAAALIKNAPGAFKSMLPIIIPIVLIVLGSLATMLMKPKGGGSSQPASAPSWWISTTLFLGQPVIALLVGVVLAALLPKKLDTKVFSMSGWVGEALTGAASILLITGAGGIFGQVLRDSKIDQELGKALTSEALKNINLGIWLPFILAASIKTAQGSSTVSLMVTSSIMAPIMGSLGFTSEMDKAVVVMAIGAGSAVFSHANDSFFWVITQLCKMDVKTGYRLHGLGTFIMGTSIAVFLWLFQILRGL
jgi:gluconate:H+ symporter, GntP family